MPNSDQIKKSLAEVVFENLCTISQKSQEGINDKCYEFLVSDEEKRNLHRQIKEIPFDTFQAWIPNNAGLLNWARIGVDYSDKNSKDKRYLFKPGLFQNDDSNDYSKYKVSTSVIIPAIEKNRQKNTHILPIEVVDLEVDINDAFTEDKSLIPVVFSHIIFKNKNAKGSYDDIVSGEGHLVDSGVYIGKTTLAYFDEKSINALNNLNIGLSLQKSYKELDQETFNASYSKLKSFLSQNKAKNAFFAEYEVESKGKVTIKPLEISIGSSVKLKIESLLTEEGYKHIVQLMYGQIKKVFHEDSHHHHKDDVILKVYKASVDSPVIPIMQMVEHIKGLEKIEKSRHAIKCNSFIPMYVHEADGIIAYIKMYYENYIEGSKHVTENPQYKQEALRYVKAAESVHKSLKAIIDRNSEKFDLTRNFKRLGRRIESELPLYLLIITVFTFVLNLFHGSNDNFADKNISDNIVALQDASVPNYLLQQIHSFLTIVIYDTTYCTSFMVIIMFFVFRGHIELFLCKKYYLHNDLRPKDRYYAFAMDTAVKKHKYQQEIKYVLFFGISISGYVLLNYRNEIIQFFKLLF